MEDGNSPDENIINLIAALKLRKNPGQTGLKNSEFHHATNPIFDIEYNGVANNISDLNAALNGHCLFLPQV